LKPDTRRAASISPAVSTDFGRALLRETPKQAGILFSAQMLSLVIGVLANLILGNAMIQTELGRFVFCQSVVLMAGLFFEVGIFSAGARVLALVKEPEEQKRAVGALVAAALVIGILFAVFIAAASYPLDLIFHRNDRALLMGAAALAFFQPFQLMIEQSCTGLNQIQRLSAFQLLAAAANLLILAVLALTDRLTASAALLSYLGGLGIASLWILSRLRPRFRGLGPFVRLTMAETKSYGFNIYLARLTGAASSRLDNLIIGYFLGRASLSDALLALYSIPQRLAAPIATLSRAVGVTRFRAFAGLPRIPARILKWNAGLLLIGSIGMASAGPVVLYYLFPKYREAAPLLIPFSVLNFFAGLFQPYNSFLASHGQGAALRNVAVAVTITSVVGLAITVPRFGITGAAWTGAVAMALDYLLHLHYYRKFEKKAELDLHRAEHAIDG